MFTLCIIHSFCSLKALNLRVDSKSTPLHAAFNLISNIHISCLPDHPFLSLSAIFPNRTKHPNSRPSFPNLALLVLPLSWPSCHSLSQLQSFLNFYQNIIYIGPDCFLIWLTLGKIPPGVTSLASWHFRGNPTPFVLQRVPSVSIKRDLGPRGFVLHPLGLFSCCLPEMSFLLPFTY